MSRTILTKSRGLKDGRSGAVETSNRHDSMNEHVGYENVSQTTCHDASDGFGRSSDDIGIGNDSPASDTAALFVWFSGLFNRWVVACWFYWSDRAAIFYKHITRGEKNITCAQITLHMITNVFQKDKVWSSQKNAAKPLRREGKMVAYASGGKQVLLPNRGGAEVDLRETLEVNLAWLTPRSHWTHGRGEKLWHASIQNPFQSPPLLPLITPAGKTDPPPQTKLGYVVNYSQAKAEM